MKGLCEIDEVRGECGGITSIEFEYSSSDFILVVIRRLRVTADRSISCITIITSDWVTRS